MKSHIATSENFFGLQIKQFICLLTGGIANKNLGHGMKVKFMRRIDSGSIG